MKDKRLRFGLAMIVLAGGALGAFAVGCDGDDTTVSPGKDSGTDATVTPDSGGTDSGVTDSGGGDADAATPQRGKVITVHASPGAGGVRICFATGQLDDGSDGVIQPLPPLPFDDTGFPAGRPFGLYPGTGGALPDLGTDLGQVAITPYIIANIAAIANDTKTKNGLVNSAKCPGLIAGAAADGGIGATGFLKLPTIPKGTVKLDSTILLAAVGCPPGISDATLQAKCNWPGSAYSIATGNLHVVSWQLDRTVTDTSKMGVQFIHASGPVQAILTASNPGAAAIRLNEGIAIPNADGGFDRTPVVPSSNLADLKPDAAAGLTPFPLATLAGTIAYAQGLAIQADGGVGLAEFAPGVNGLVPFPVLAAQRFAGYDPVPSDAGGGPIFKAGENFTFILVGDPQQSTYLDPFDGGPSDPDAGVFNTRSPHFIALPSNPAVKSGL